MWCITTASVVEPLQYSTSFISVKRLGIKRYRRTEVYLEQKWLKNGTILLMSCLLKMHFCLLLSLLPWFWFCILPCHLALFSSVFIVCCFFPFVLPFYLATWFIISLTLTPWWLSLCLFALFFLLSFFFFCFDSFIASCFIPYFDYEFCFFMFPFGFCAVLTLLYLPFLIILCSGLSFFLLI